MQRMPFFPSLVVAALAALAGPAALGACRAREPLPSTPLADAPPAVVLLAKSRLGPTLRDAADGPCAALHAPAP